MQDEQLYHEFAERLNKCMIGAPKTEQLLGILKTSYTPEEIRVTQWLSFAPEDLETIVIALRELGLSYEETVKLMSGVTKDVKSLRSLWGKPKTGRQKGSRLIKLGAALIAFPIPTIGIKKSLGATLIAAGLLKERMAHIHVADVYSTFQEVNRELRKLQQSTRI